MTDPQSIPVSGEHPMIPVSVGPVVSAARAFYVNGVRCVVMPCCGFAFDAGHTDDKPGPPQYTCPLCKPSSA